MPNPPFDPPKEDFCDVPFSRTRRTIAEHMTRSLQVGAQLTSVIEIDVTEMMQARAKVKDQFRGIHGISLTPLAVIASALIETLQAFPEFNAHILSDGKTARLFRDVNLGIAVGRDEGLIVPVIRQANRLTLPELAKSISDVAERARARGALAIDDITGGTFTLTNYGSFGALLDTPIIAQPQVAILGTGSIEKRPAVVNEAITIRYLMLVSLTYDHRWIDGHRAALFNASLKTRLQDPGHFGSTTLLNATTTHS